MAEVIEKREERSSEVTKESLTKDTIMVEEVKKDEQDIQVNNRTVRFSGSPWYEPGITAIIGGAGGIGSWLSFFLGRQEAELFIFDFDNYDESNTGGQLVHTRQIGMNKATAIKETISLFSNNNTVETFGKYTEESFSNNVVFSGFDNMKAREIMFNNWVKYYEKNKNKEGLRFIFIDGRLLAEQGEVYFVTPDKIKDYRATLFSDDEVPNEDCTYKATSHCSAILAGYMVSGFNNFITNCKKGNIRDLPFSINFALPLLTFETK